MLCLGGGYCLFVRIVVYPTVPMALYEKAARASQTRLHGRRITLTKLPGPRFGYLTYIILFFSSRAAIPCHL